MSFLSWGWLTVVHSQSGMSEMSFESPPAKYLSALPLIGSVTNTCSPADPPPVNSEFQSSPAAAWPSTLPSSSNTPSSWTARTGVGAAIATYCNSSEHNSTAVQRSTRLFRAPVPNAYRNPRDIMGNPLPVDLAIPPILPYKRLAAEPDPACGRLPPAAARIWDACRGLA